MYHKITPPKNVKYSVCVVGGVGVLEESPPSPLWGGGGGGGGGRFTVTPVLYPPLPVSPLDSRLERF